VGAKRGRDASLDSTRLVAWGAAGQGPEEIAAAREASREIDAALGSLPDEQREVVILRHYEIGFAGGTAQNPGQQPLIRAPAYCTQTATPLGNSIFAIASLTFSARSAW
jgi:hypothetical protein